MVAGSEGPEADLLEELGRRLRAVETLLAGLADDMAAAGARSASERAERGLAELRVAADIAARLRDPAAGR
jgi:hypothetical protein